jgi:hypothetical protein
MPVVERGMFRCEWNRGRSGRAYTGPQSRGGVCRGGGLVF